ncbi:MAG: glycosyltransferase family 2 protein, partial [Planctomycetota bacterium]
LPSSLPILYQALKNQEADLIVGNRFLHSTPYHPSFPRRLGMKMFSGVVRLLTKVPLFDTTSGFQGMTKPLYEWYTEEHFPRDFPDADILIRTHFQGFRIREVPAEMKIPPGNISMHRGFLRPLYYVLKMWFSILQVFFRYRLWR